MRNERYDFIHLPEEFHKSHKACELLLYQIEDFVNKEHFKGLRLQKLHFDEEPKFLEGEHILDYLEREELNETHNEIITSVILNAIISDTCHFLQIALFSSLQRRLSVAYSLIRKPFVYNLIVILRLYFTEDFLSRFNVEEMFDTAYLKPEETKELLSASKKALFSKSIDPELIYNLIFNQDSPNSIINVSNRALHPSTTRNRNNLTGIKNINFVSQTEDSTMSLWRGFYSSLPLLLLFYNEVLEYIVFDHLKIDDAVYTDRLAERAAYWDQNGS